MMGHLYYHTKKYSYFQPTTDKNDVKIRLGLNTALKSHQKVNEYPRVIHKENFRLHIENTFFFGFFHF
jgi:hypothetical protein